MSQLTLLAAAPEVRGKWQCNDSVDVVVVVVVVGGGGGGSDDGVVGDDVDGGSE